MRIFLFLLRLSFLVVCAAIPVGLFVLWWYWPQLLPCELEDLTQKGQYGDSFGALNTLFTGLAMVFVGCTLYLQLQERRQRDRERYEEVFESRVFRLSDSIRSLIAGMTATLEGKQYAGKDALKVFCSSMLHNIYEIDGNAALLRLWTGETPHERRSIPKDVLVKGYEKVYDEHHNDLGPYFRMLYHIFRYIHRSRVKDRKEYSDLIRAELSSAELILLAVSALTERGKKFKPLIEEYHLLKHLPEGVSDDMTEINNIKALFERLPRDKVLDIRIVTVIRAAYHPSAFDEGSSEG